MKIPAGGIARLAIALPPRGQRGFDLELDAPPEGISIGDVTPDRRGLSVVVSRAFRESHPIAPGSAVPGV